jgi:internalin A
LPARTKKLATANNIITISPIELDGWLGRARAERWQQLAIVGPDTVEVEWTRSLEAIERVIRVDAPVTLSVGKLRKLQGLNSLLLCGLDIGPTGAKAIAASLAGLTSLNLESNHIGVEGSKAIAASLTGLTSLTIWRDNIGAEGAKAIATSLTGLRSLSLGADNIGAQGAKAIAASLTGLTSLDLWASDVGDGGAEAIAASLTGLTTLNLGGSNIGAEGARAIAASLTGLTSLTLWGNTLRHDGGGVTHGGRARVIGTQGAKAIASLTGLASLNLGGNDIGAEGAKAIAASLTGLTSLELWGNDIGAEGAKAIAASLTGLTSLDLRSSNIGAEGAKAIVGAWSARPDSAHLRELDLRNNGDLSSLLPKEALETSDAQIILAAYRSFKRAREAGTAQPLNEVKLLVVGNEAVGKTSLLRYLIHNKPRDPSQVRTPGIVLHEKIEVQSWSPQHCDIKLNVWDFGGQEMLRGTHRFFLTERSLYLLLLDDRRPDDRTYEGLLKTIRNCGGDSPIIVAINKSDEGKKDLRLDEKGLRESYPNIVAFSRTSCDPGEWAANSIAALRQQIVEVIKDDSRLRHVRDPIPNNWLAIKNRVSRVATQRSVLPNADFIALCEKPGAGVKKITNASEQHALLQLLHHLGVIIAHGLGRDSSAASREITLLDPNWLTGAIYRVLEMAKTNECDGEFSRANLSQWLDPQIYPARWHEFILTMIRDPDIGLCFRLPAQGEERYLIPEALPPGAPDRHRWPEAPLRFRYRYGFLPTGLIPRFIVQSHRNLAGKRSRWKQGVELAAADCNMLIIADLEDRRVDIEVAGPLPLRRSALNIVLNDLDAVHRLNPEAEPIALVPLPDNPKEQVRYEHLLMLEREKGPDYAFFPEGATREYQVSELLDDVRRGASARQQVMEVNIMGDQYNVSGQAGALGPNAHAHDMSFSQAWSKVENTVDLARLAEELGRLHEALELRATEPAQKLAAGAIAAAEQSAKQKNGPKALEYLKMGGKWAVDVAGQIGVEVAKTAITSALGVG